MNSNSFEKLCLNKSILRALVEEGYTNPTDIQLAAIPEILAGKDLVATAQTGTGKTAAFALPLLETLHARQTHGRGNIRALVLTPTRELAQQVEMSLRAYGRYLSLRSAVLVGGLSIHAQVKALRQNPAIVVATPGRLLDLLRQKQLRLADVEVLVLDEADRMLDMGFINDVRTIVRDIPRTRQTLLFSATMSSEITALASEILRNPATVKTAPPASVAINIDQKVHFVERANKAALLAHTLKGKGVLRTLVFARTRNGADRIVWQLSKQGVSADAIHSNKSQNVRQSTLLAFGRGRIAVLVATDIMARGIDVDGISHVINYELPDDPQNYIHRVGRTARAGAVGTAISFCDATEVVMLNGIERLTKSALTRDEDQPFHSGMIASLHRPASSGASSHPSKWRSFGPRGRRGR